MGRRCASIVLKAIKQIGITTVLSSLIPLMSPTESISKPATLALCMVLRITSKTVTAMSSSGLTPRARQLTTLSASIEKTGINSGTYEGGDQVLIQQAVGEGEVFAKSTLVGKLSQGGSHMLSNFLSTGKKRCDFS